MSAGLIGLAVLVLVVCLYFLPAIVASSRKHHNANAICIVNLLFGWTVIGWCIALIWAVTNPPPRAA